MSDFEELSDRELDVLRCVVQSGASNKEIASELSISHHTVKVHLRNIYAKLDVSSRTEAATIAIQQGLVTIPGLELSASDQPAATTEPKTAVLTPPATPETAVIPPTTQASPPRTHSLITSPLFLGILSLLLLAAIGLLWFGPPWAATSATPTPGAFTETAIGETRWSLSRPLPTPLAGMSIAAVGLTLYQIGGETADGVVTATLAYNTSERQWTELAAKPTAVTDAGTAVLFGEIYVIGGRLANGEPTNTVEAYSPAQNGWRIIAPLPQPVSGGLALTDGSFLYLFGGWDSEQYLDTVFVYDPAADSWRPLPPMSQPRAFAAGGSLTGQLYVVGGTDGTAELDSCQYLEPNEGENGRWFDCSPMLQPRAGAAAAVMRNRLYVIGGGQNGGTITYSEMYDPNNDRWQVVNTPVLENASSWFGLGVAAVETQLYALGGRLDGEPTADTYVYTAFFQTFIPAASGGAE
jgi:DNA-binding CsgD family transcriptional regulator